MYLAELSQLEDPVMEERMKLREKFCCLSNQREAERVAFVQEKYEQRFRYFKILNNLQEMISKVMFNDVQEYFLIHLPLQHRLCFSLQM